MSDKCFVSVDGIDFSIDEPERPMNPKWYSHKLNRAGIRYELAVAIHTGWIIWSNGPFPAGEYSDLTIVRQSLNHCLCNNECYIADGGYRDGYQWAITPSGHNSYQDRQISVIRSRHETVNSRLRQWKILSERYRHNLEKHSWVFLSVVNIIQLSLQLDSPAFQVHYNETEF